MCLREAAQWEATSAMELGLGNENSARSFSDRSFLSPPSRRGRPRFGSWMPAPTCSFFQDSEGLTEVFAPDVRRDIRVDVRGISGPKTYSLGCFFVPEGQGGLPRKPSLPHSEPQCANGLAHDYALGQAGGNFA